MAGAREEKKRNFIEICHTRFEIMASKFPMVETLAYPNSVVSKGVSMLCVPAPPGVFLPPVSWVLKLFGCEGTEVPVKRHRGSRDRSSGTGCSKTQGETLVGTGWGDTKAASDAARSLLGRCVTNSFTHKLPRRKRGRRILLPWVEGSRQAVLKLTGSNALGSFTREQPRIGLRDDARS